MHSNSPIHESNVLVFQLTRICLHECACTSRCAHYNTPPTPNLKKYECGCTHVHPTTNNNTPTCVLTRTRSFVRPTYEQIPYRLWTSFSCSSKTRASLYVFSSPPSNNLTKQTKGLGCGPITYWEGMYLLIEPLKDLLLVEWVKRGEGDDVK